MLFIAEDDINEIKQDVSSFRYELLGILKTNGMHIPENEKKAQMSTTGSKGHRSRNKAKKLSAALAYIGRSPTQPGTTTNNEANMPKEAETSFQLPPD